MTNKFNSAEAIIKNGGNCIGVVNNCPNCCLEGRCSVAIKHYSDNEYDLKLAIEYKKEHEMKGKVIAEWQPVKGEHVLGCQLISEEWREYVYVNTMKEAIAPYYLAFLEDEYSLKNGEKVNLFDFSYIKQIPIPKYKAYTEPNFNWIDKEIFDKKTGKIYIIKGFLKIGNLLFLHFKNVEKLKNSINEDDVSYNNATLYGLFKFYTWSDGTPCGELINE